MVRQRPWLRAKQLGGVTVGATSLLWVRCLEHFHRSASILPYCTSASMAEADQTAVDPELNSTSASATTSASTVTTTGNDSDDCPVAFLETPEGRRIAYCKRDGSQPGIVFVHGIGSVMQGNKVTALDDYCRTKGVSFVRFDLSGHGQSSERFKETNVSIWLEDLTAVMELLTTGPQLLVGSSLGGWLVFLYTMRNPERVAGLVGIATAVDFTQRLWKGLDKTTREEVKRSGVYHMDSPYIPDLEITMDFIMDGEKHGILDVPGIQIIKTPVWLLHGDQDSVVPPDVSIELMHKMECSVELKIVEGGDHRLSTPENLSLMLHAVDSILHPHSVDEQKTKDQGGADDDED